MTVKQWAGAVGLVVLVLCGLWTVREIQSRRGGEGIPAAAATSDDDAADVVRLFANPAEVPEFSVQDLVTGKTISSREWRGKVVLGELLGDVVSSLPRRDPGPDQVAEEISRFSSSSSGCQKMKAL